LEEGTPRLGWECTTSTLISSLINVIPQVL
jgi:hypothetical protein